MFTPVAVSATRAWCQGILEATKDPTQDPAEVLPNEFTPSEAIEFVPAEIEDVES